LLHVAQRLLSATYTLSRNLPLSCSQALSPANPCREQPPKPSLAPMWRKHSCVRYQHILYTQSQYILYTWRLWKRGRRRRFSEKWKWRWIVFPPEPPVAMVGGHHGAEPVKGAPECGAAKRTLAGEHRCGKAQGIDGRRRGNTIVIPAGGLRVFCRHVLPAGPRQASREEWGSPRGKKPWVSFPLDSLSRQALPAEHTRSNIDLV